VLGDERDHQWIDAIDLEPVDKTGGAVRRKDRILAARPVRSKDDRHLHGGASISKPASRFVSAREAPEAILAG
jgi:hypothetical protein